MSDNKSAILTEKDLDEVSMLDPYWLLTPYERYVLQFQPKNDFIFYNFIINLSEWDCIFKLLYVEFKDRFDDIERHEDYIMKRIKNGFDFIIDTYKFKFYDLEFKFEDYEENLWNMFLDKFPKINN